MSFLTGLIRRRAFQPLWQLLHKASLIGMSYWSSEFETTGEHEALAIVASSLRSRDRPIVFDVGANVGTFSLACLDLFGTDCRLHAFEPSLATFDMLKAALHGRGGECHQLGFSDHTAQLTLHTSEPGSSIASLVELTHPIRPFDPALDETVSLTTLDEFCHAQGIEHIDFLKMDIEGHEWWALVGAKALITCGRIDAIQFEFGENNISARTYLADFVKLLPEYDLFRIVPGRPIPWVYEGGRSEIFATMNYLAVRRAAANKSLLEALR